MDEQAFFRMVTEQRYTVTTDPADLQSALSNVVRVRSVATDGTTKYLLGGVLTRVDLQQGFISFKSLINTRTYRLNVGPHKQRHGRGRHLPGLTFYVLDPLDNELNHWQMVVNKLP